MVNPCQHVKSYMRERVGQQPSILDLVYLLMKLPFVNDFNIMNGTDTKRTVKKEIAILMSGQEGVRQG